MKKTWPIEIDCPNCAAKLEAALAQLPGVEHARVDYVRKTVTLAAKEADFARLTQAMVDTARQIEPDAVIHLDGEGKPGHHHGAGCACCHGEHDHNAHEHDHHHERGHEHGHDHGRPLPFGLDEEKLLLVRMIASAVLLAAGMLLPWGWRAALLLAAYAIAGYDVLLRAVRNILRGQIFDENFLMTVASVGALLMGDYAEGAAVMLLYQVGEWFQDKAVDKSRASIAGLMDIRPDYANLLEADGQVRTVDPEEVAVGDTILIKPGEKVPLDGVVLSGSSSLNTVALTGEALPRDVAAGDSVVSGCVNLSGLLTVRVSSVYGESTVAKILDLVENSGQAKASTERFITRFARVYTPLVCLAALLLAVIPSLVDGQWLEWIRRALTFLVISCPCALVISVPLTFFSGIGAASRKGILVKGANHLETLADLSAVVFDKTGTLTKGVFSVTAVHPAQGSEDALLETAALAESWSDHPISKSLQAAWGKPLDPQRVSDAEELAGHGVKALVDGRTIHAGNERLMATLGLTVPPCQVQGTVVHVARDGQYLGHIVISDEVKPTSAQAMADLKAAGVQRLIMLTGDRQAVAEDIAARLGLTEVHAQLLPEDKVSRMEGILGGGGKVAFCGDGINDAPVLRRADLGIAMGAMGSDAAIEAADVVLMDDDPVKLPLAIRIARRTMRIARENIVFALGVKAIVLLMGALGHATMWLAVFADVGVAMLAILNAMRAMRIK